MYARASDFEEVVVYYSEERPGYVAWASLFQFGNGELGIAFNEIRRGRNPNFQPPTLESVEAIQVPYRVLEGGLLTGKYTDPSSPPEGSRGAEKPDWIPGLSDPEVMRRVGELAEEARRQGMGLFEYTLRETLGVPGITSVILGFRRLEQLEQAVKAVS